MYLSTHHDYPTIDHQSLTGHETCGFRCQKDAHSTQLFRVPMALQGHIYGGYLIAILILPDGGGEARLEDTGAERIHAYIITAVLCCKIANQCKIRSFSSSRHPTSWMARKRRWMT